jgi:thioredoxin reductase (NADPH)
VLQQRIRESPKVALHLDCVVQGIEGAGGVEAVLIRNVSTSVSFRLPVEGVFIFIGTIPNSELVREWGQVDQEGYIITDEQMATSVPGLFAAGDVRRKELRQVVTAVADGAVAAMSAKKYLENGCLVQHHRETYP